MVMTAAEYGFAQSWVIDKEKALYGMVDIEGESEYDFEIRLQTARYSFGNGNKMSFYKQHNVILEKYLSAKRKTSMNTFKNKTISVMETLQLNDWNFTITTNAHNELLIALVKDSDSKEELVYKMLMTNAILTETEVNATMGYYLFDILG